MTPEELAKPLRHAVRTHVPGGGEQFLDQLVDLANGAHVLALAQAAENALNDEHADRQILLENLIEDIRRALAPERRAKVVLFKSSGKYYTEEEWRVPRVVPDHSPQRGNYVRGVMIPADMEHSPDFRRIDGGAVLVESSDELNWPPHLFPAES